MLVAEHELSGALAKGSLRAKPISSQVPCKHDAVGSYCLLLASALGRLSSFYKAALALFYSVQGERLFGGWRQVAGARWLEAGGWRQVAGGRWLQAGGWRQVAGGWRVVAGGLWQENGGVAGGLVWPVYSRYGVSLPNRTETPQYWQ